jgi:hypothetical protein
MDVQRIRLPATMAELTRKQTLKLGLYVATISVCGTLLASIAQPTLESWLEAPRLRAEVATVRESLAAKTSELQQLQTEFIPFRTVALSSFSGTESERVAKLALLLGDVQDTLAIINERQAEHERFVAKVKEVLPALKETASSTKNSVAQAALKQNIKEIATFTEGMKPANVRISIVPQP